MKLCYRREKDSESVVKINSMIIYLLPSLRLDVRCLISLWTRSDVSMVSEETEGEKLPELELKLVQAAGVNVDVWILDSTQVTINKYI